MENSIYDLLIEPFEPDNIEWRVQQCGISNKTPWVLVFAYVKARAIQNRLDNIFGFQNWSEEYRAIEGNIICRLGVNLNGTWIYKENGASETNIEHFKGGISGAFKRVAASGFGIGRYLYNLEAVFANCQTGKNDLWNKCKTQDKTVIYWDTPKLPDWALPSGNDHKELVQIWDSLDDKLKEKNKELFTTLKTKLRS